VRHKAEGDRRETVVIFKSKLGWAGIAASEQGLTRIILPEKDKKSAERELMSSEQVVSTSLPGKAVRLLQRYFSGAEVVFDLPLDLRYYTTFQRAVWKAAAAIPYGETRSYAWIAKRIRKPLAARAVGRAMGANPVPIIIP
jgi:methylated-DNA-[protein]-cysteine S-methyltransferase